jgi:hypothetical protein
VTEQRWRKIHAHASAVALTGVVKEVAGDPSGSKIDANKFSALEAP